MVRPSCIQLAVCILCVNLKLNVKKNRSFQEELEHAGFGSAGLH